MTTVPDISALKPRFSGALLQPGGMGYDTARQVFNAMIDRRPGLIAQCRSVSDVTRITAPELIDRTSDATESAAMQHQPTAP